MYRIAFTSISIVSCTSVDKALLVRAGGVVSGGDIETRTGSKSFTTILWASFSCGRHYDCLLLFVSVWWWDLQCSSVWRNWNFWNLLVDRSDAPWSFGEFFQVQRQQPDYFVGNTVWNVVIKIYCKHGIVSIVAQVGCATEVLKWRHDVTWRLRIDES